MAKNEEKPQVTNDSKTTDDTVARVVAGFNSSWNYTSASWHPEWQNMQRLYDSERVFVGYNGISDTFVPMSFGTVETMVAATSGDKPEVEYVPTDPSQETNTEVLNGLFSFYWDLDSWTNKFIQYARGLYKLGTTVMYTYWDIDHPVVRNIPLRDFFIDPNATILNYQDAAYMGYRFLGSKKAMKEEKVVDPDSGELVDKYKNLDKLGTGWNSDNQTDKEEKDTHMGSTLDKEASKDQVEVLCYWTKEEVIYVANREAVIYRNKNYYKERQEFLGYENPTGMYPFIVDALYPDESQLYGRSLLQPIAKPQELLNDMTNQNIDAVSWALDPVMELDPQYISYIDKIKNVTGAVYPFKPGSLSAVQKPIVPSNVFNERTNIKNEIREATAIDQVIKGVAPTGDTTATEVKAQLASAGKRFDLILAQLENGGYYQFAKLIFQMVQMYVTAPTMFRVLGKEGIDWKQFDPKAFKGDYEPRIKLRASVEEETMRTMRNVKEMYTALLGSPYVKQSELTKLTIQRGFQLEPGEVQELVKTEEELMQEAQGMPGNNGKGDNGDPKELINYKDAPPDIQAQMEEAAGYTPSDSHQYLLETSQMESAAKQATALGTVMPQDMMPGLGVAPSMPPPQPAPVGAPDAG